VHLTYLAFYRAYRDDSESDIGKVRCKISRPHYLLITHITEQSSLEGGWLLTSKQVILEDPQKADWHSIYRYQLGAKEMSPQNVYLLSTPSAAHQLYLRNHLYETGTLGSVDTCGTHANMRCLVKITTKTTGEVGAVQKLDLKMTLQVHSFQIVARPQVHGSFDPILCPIDPSSIVQHLSIIWKFSKQEFAVLNVRSE
jgi:hypothetical protein